MGVKKHIEYRYDALGNRVGMTDPDGGRFTYSYDVVGRLKTVVNPQAQRTTFLYDLAGRRTGTLLANGSRTSTVYDDGSRITAVYNRKSNGDPQTTFEYQYDNSGNRTSVVELDGTRVTWTYDAARRLQSEHRGGIGGYRHTFTYDSRGNRTLKIEDGVRTTYAYDAANQLRYSEAALGRTTYIYDADGNQQVTIEPSGGRTTNVWDYENRLSRAELPSGVRNTMAYDPEGLRVKLEESGGTKKFIWDDQNYLAETNGADVTQTVYTSEPQTYGNLISHRQGGATTWYQFDALGSTRALANSSEVLLASYNYGAWGTILGSPVLLTPFLWVGRMGYHWGQETQNQYVRARYYRPVIARWVSVDQLFLHSYYQRSSSSYVYAVASPLVWIDVNGKEPVRRFPDRPPSPPVPIVPGFDVCPPDCPECKDRNARFECQRGQGTPEVPYMPGVEQCRSEARPPDILRQFENTEIWGARRCSPNTCCSERLRVRTRYLRCHRVPLIRCPGDAEADRSRPYNFKLLAVVETERTGRECHCISLPDLYCFTQCLFAPGVLVSTPQRCLSSTGLDPDCDRLEAIAGSFCDALSRLPWGDRNRQVPNPENPNFACPPLQYPFA